MKPEPLTKEIQAVVDAAQALVDGWYGGDEGPLYMVLRDAVYAIDERPGLRLRAVDYDAAEDWLVVTDDDGAAQIVARDVPAWFGVRVVAAFDHLETTLDSAPLLAEYAWEQVNGVAGQSSWSWTDLDAAEMGKAIASAREWLARK